MSKTARTPYREKKTKTKTKGRASSADRSGRCRFNGSKGSSLDIAPLAVLDSGMALAVVPRRKLAVAHSPR